MKTIFTITNRTQALWIGETSSVIFEGGEKKYSMHKPEKIIDNSCIVNGSTLEGRKEAVKDLFNIKHKIPIPVNPLQGVVVFPTSSTKSKECVWLAYYQIDKYESVDDNTLITFIDGSDLLVHTSEDTIDRQHKRTSQIVARLTRHFYPGY